MSRPMAGQPQAWSNAQGVERACDADSDVPASGWRLKFGDDLRAPRLERSDARLGSPGGRLGHSPPFQGWGRNPGDPQSRRDGRITPTGIAPRTAHGVSRAGSGTPPENSASG